MLLSSRTWTLMLKPELLMVVCRAEKLAPGDTPNTCWSRSLKAS